MGRKTLEIDALALKEFKANALPRVALQETILINGLPKTLGCSG